MFDGIININKEKNMTSHDVVNIVRRKLGIKKVGHTGTLDPMATGVLPVCIGKATKLASFITDGNKVYRVQMQLGISTDTYDITGEILEQRDVNVSAEEVRAAVLSFIGEQEQVPPMYSAIKQGGKKLYELARAGKIVERKARKINIFYIDKLEIDGYKIGFEVACSKGTYIRSLVFDIGEKLGALATMTELERVSVSGGYSIDKAIKVSDFKVASEEEIRRHITTLEEYFDDLDKIKTDEKIHKYLYNGNKLVFSADKIETMLSEETKEAGLAVNVYSAYDEYMGVYTFKKNKGKYELSPKYFFDFRKIDNENS